MRPRTLAGTCGLLVVPLVCHPVAADVVTLTDGSQLVGVVEGWVDGKLVLQTEFAGKLEIDAAMVKTIEAEQKLNVALNSGDRLVGNVVPSADGEGYVIQTQHADIAVKNEDVQAIWKEGDKSPETRALEEAIAKAEGQWAVHAEASFQMKEGNTESIDARGAFSLTRSTDDDVLKFYIKGDYGETDHVKDTYEIIGGVDYEAWFTERWSWYARVELEYDEFEDLDLRTTAATGLGYTWIKQEDINLKTRAGLGYVNESYDNGDNDSYFAADLGLAFRWDIAEWVRFTQDTTYVPSLEYFSDYRIVADTALAVPLAGSEVWKFKVGMINDYNSMPEPGVDRLDNTYYAGIAIDIDVK